MRTDLILKFLLILILGGAAGAAAMEMFSSVNRDLPLQISSRQLEVFQEQQKSVFTGNVIAQQGDMTLYTDLLTVFVDTENELRRIEAAGSVRIEDPLRQARSDHAIYDRLDEVLILSGHAEVVQGENRISGDEITLFIGENRSLVKSSETGRVRAVILPEKKTESP